VRRTASRNHRPLLRQGDPETILARLMDERYPIYAEADVQVQCGDDSPDVTTGRVAAAVTRHAPPLRVPVPLAQTPYEVIIGEGLIARAGAYLAPILPQKRAVVITDSHVGHIHLANLLAGLAETGIEARTITVPAGEASKNFATYQHVVESLLEAGVERRTAVIALGGGVIGDLAGFAAATTLRGLPFVQVPTTLLAQVDSSVGGKTGVNSTRGKNLVGAFHQPLLVLADTTTLHTLPPRERRNGYAEIVKAGLISDAALYEWCEANAAAMLEGDDAKLTEAIERAVLFKAAVVAGDERETQPNNGRALLNLGHTFAHALEAETGYGSALLHGEAVATGLVLATHLSAALNLCPQEDVSRVAAHIAQIGLPPRIAGLNAENLLAHMKQDKKMRSGKLHFVLTHGIGQAFTNSDVPEATVRATLLANGAV
jgi:shikimate kinase/3-dehydroquinate synthase